MTGRLLVVNADDFGLTPGINAGIVAAHERGVLTSASIFPNAPATHEALVLAARVSTLGVGCHLTLVDGEPLLPPAGVPTLAPEGRFRPTWGAFIAAALVGRIALQEIERELTAQIEHVRGGGITLTHLDAHKHVHAFPPVFAVVARLAKRFGIARVRVPVERPAIAAVRRHRRANGTLRQALENVALAPWGAYDRRMLARHGLPPAPWFLGRVQTGRFTIESLVELIESTREGVSELMTHPGFVDPALDRVRTRLRSERAAELLLLMNSAVRAAVDRAGITLVRHDGRGCAERWSHAS